MKSKLKYPWSFIIAGIIFCIFSCNKNEKKEADWDTEEEFTDDRDDNFQSDEIPELENYDEDEIDKSFELPPAKCTTGTKWQEGVSIFREITHESLLDVIGALGVRISAVDYDNDGWADIVARLGGASGDDFNPGGKRVTWLLKNRGDGTFEDVTLQSGIMQMRSSNNPNHGRPGEVFAFADVNNDGCMDVFTGLTFNPSSLTDETSEILLNNCDGTFRLGPEDSDIRRTKQEWDSVAGASFVDFDRDGCIDLWVVENTFGDNPAQDRLYKGDCTGVFRDETLIRGLGTRPWVSVSDLNQALCHSWGWAASACDLNNDGWFELMASSYGRAPNHMWLASETNNNVTYENISVASGYAYDNRMDWTDNESARCWCQLHPADEDCAGVPPPEHILCRNDSDAFRWDHTYDREPFRLGGNSATTICADINNDGWLDLVTSEIVHWDVGSSSDPAELLINKQNPHVEFQRPGNDVTGLARTYYNFDWNEGIMSGVVFDFDNDGWKDIYWGNSDYPGDYGLLYHQDREGHFEPVPKENGIDHHRSHGAATADFNHDGAIDIVVGHSFARCNGDSSPDSYCYPTQQIRLFENVFASDGNFIEIKLIGGEGSNKSAIGARVTATAGGTTQIHEVGGGYGHYGAQNDFIIHFGLGNSCEAEVTIIWPDKAKTTQKFTLPAGYAFSITQGQQPVVLWGRD